MPVRHGTELKLLARPPAQSGWGRHLQTLPLSQSYWMVTSELDLWVIGFCLSLPLFFTPAHAVLGPATPPLSFGVQTIKTLLKG